VLCHQHLWCVTNNWYVPSLERKRLKEEKEYVEYLLKDIGKRLLEACDKEKMWVVLCTFKDHEEAYKQFEIIDREIDFRHSVLYNKGYELDLVGDRQVGFEGPGGGWIATGDSSYDIVLKPKTEVFKSIPQHWGK
jgi:hypothetical protein